MKRVAILTFSTVFLAATALSTPAMAYDSPDPFAFISADSPGFAEYQGLIERLDEEGATILLIEKTFLGRLRIVSTVGGKVRETVISPNTGEIRRDIIIGDYNPADYAPGNSGNAPGKTKSNNGKSADHSNSGGNGGGNGKGKNK